MDRDPALRVRHDQSLIHGIEGRLETGRSGDPGILHAADIGDVHEHAEDGRHVARLAAFRRAARYDVADLAVGTDQPQLELVVARLRDYGVRFTRPVPVPAQGPVRIEVEATVGLLDQESGEARIDIAARVDGTTVLGRAQARVALG